MGSAELAKSAQCDNVAKVNEFKAQETKAHEFNANEDKAKGSKVKELKGINTVIAAPFTANGEVDYASMLRLIKHLKGIGCHGITMFGIASEFHKLCDAERDALAKQLADELRDSDTCCVMSVTDHSKEVAVKRARFYESLGADVIMVLPPFFLNPSIEQIKDHIFAILEAVKCPVLIQYAPGETKKLIDVEEMASIKRRYPHALFKLEPNPPMDYVRSMLKLESDAKIFIGYAGLYMIDVLKAGGKGTMPGCSFAEVYLEIDRRFAAGDIAGAEALHAQLMRYVKVWMTNPEYIISIEKYILKLRGIIDTDYCRAPFYQLSEQDKSDCQRFIEEFAELLK